MNNATGIIHVRVYKVTNETNFITTSPVMDIAHVASLSGELSLETEERFLLPDEFIS
jgi:hypothetical protein